MSGRWSGRLDSHYRYKYIAEEFRVHKSQQLLKERGNRLILGEKNCPKLFSLSGHWGEWGKYPPDVRLKVFFEQDLFSRWWVNCHFIKGDQSRLCILFKLIFNFFLFGKNEIGNNFGIKKHIVGPMANGRRKGFSLHATACRRRRRDQCLLFALPFLIWCVCHCLPV